ncbi:gastric triacylglycerol lipase [Nasonia vitripennis]|uniref:Lipase n=1 Tax=Nasonia vitripennis TaxID=7425 RepID=A0A7M7IYJ3_NASVI|nr:gastric triacylglycerol lipase [Nasonia vitripennis]
MKIIAIFLCAFVTSSSADYFDFLKKILFSKNVSPARVRTEEECNSRTNESVILDFIGLVEQYDGYKAEEYNITTDDGYILGLHRISGSPSHPKTDGKRVIYIQHGLFGSSDFLVLLGPHRSLAFYLADAGYDVWLGNVRGNVYSKSHITYGPKSSRFWNFRMDEMAEKDISKFIDVVLEKTRQTKLTYIGYSMGTTLSYMLLSSKPEYNEKIDLLVSLAPVAFFTPPASILIKSLISTILLANKFSNEILPQSIDIAQFAKDSCNNSAFNPCKIFLSHFARGIHNLSEPDVQKILAYTPAGTSYYTVEHYQQLMNNDRKFQKYDFNTRWYTSNMGKYYQTTPPQYDVSSINAAHIIIYSLADVFVKVEDAKYLKDNMKNVIAFEEVADKNFNHVDFIWSVEAKKLVYEPLLKIMSKHH